MSLALAFCSCLIFSDFNYLTPINRPALASLPIAKIAANRCLIFWGNGRDKIVNWQEIERSDTVRWRFGVNIGKGGYASVGCYRITYLCLRKEDAIAYPFGKLIPMGKGPLPAYFATYMHGPFGWVQGYNLKYSYDKGWSLDVFSQLQDLPQTKRFNYTREELMEMDKRR